jgi:hypothetical protein
MTPGRPYDPRLPIPAETRVAVLGRAGNRCERCGRRRRLELHHRHYNSQGRERPEDLYALCRDCHHASHLDPLGEYWVDPVQMNMEWGFSPGEDVSEWDIDHSPGWRD